MKDIMKDQGFEKHIEFLSLLEVVQQNKLMEE